MADIMDPIAIINGLKEVLWFVDVAKQQLRNALRSRLSQIADSARHADNAIGYDVICLAGTVQSDTAWRYQ